MTDLSHLPGVPGLWVRLAPINTTTTMKPVIITGRAAALVSKYTNFDPANPGATKADEFTFAHPDYVNDKGVLAHGWAKDGYRHVGWAEIKIELIPPQDLVANQIKALQAAKAKLLAQAQDMDNQIANLLALPFDTATMEVEP